MKAECPFRFGYEDFAAASEPDSPLEVSAPCLEAASLFTQVAEPARSLEGGGLAGNDRECAAEEDQEPQQDPVPPLKPHHRQETFAV